MVMYKQELQLRDRGFEMIAGVDEAGRGPLAGPVVAGAILLDPFYKNSAINDSKQLTAIEREQLFVELKNRAISYAVGVVGWKQIDEMGISNASKLAMRQAVLKLDPAPDFILSDAFSINTPGIPQMAVIKGDATVFSIAAASIIAKVSRDKLMANYHKKYPQYGFNEHMGYGTEVHLKMIKEHGPCPIHRMSFSPLNVF